MVGVKYVLTDCEGWEHQPPAIILVPTGQPVPRVGEAVWLSPAVLRGRAPTFDELNDPTVEFEVVEVRYEMTGDWRQANVKPIVTIQWQGSHG